MPPDRPTLDLDPASTPLHELVPVGRWLGMKSESAIYDAANRGQIPTITLGRRKMVPTAELRRMVGLDHADDEEQGPTLSVIAGGGR